jgi:hypothetical protein
MDNQCERDDVMMAADEALRSVDRIERPEASARHAATPINRIQHVPSRERRDGPMHGIAHSLQSGAPFRGSEVGYDRLHGEVCEGHGRAIGLEEPRLPCVLPNLVRERRPPAHRVQSDIELLLP